MKVVRLCTLIFLNSCLHYFISGIHYSQSSFENKDVSTHYESTGHQLVDAIIGLQIIADNSDDPDAKLRYLRTGLATVNARQLITRQFLVSSFQAFVQGPDMSPDTRSFYDSGLFFIGKLDLYRYLLDEEVPVDSLLLDFVQPEVIGAAKSDLAQIKQWRIQVPILAIESCIDAEAA
jgi:hypothetical protein